MVAIAIAGGCSERTVEPGEVTRTSAAALEEGQRQLAAGNVSAAREAFAAAADGGGLQPDFYCEARLQQAWCAARLGDTAEALTLLDALATGAPDLERIEKVRAYIRSRQPAAGTTPKTDEPTDPVPAGDS